MTSRFVRPEIHTLRLDNGDTLTVRKRLTAGEQRAMYARMYSDGAGGLTVNTLETGIAMMLAYLLDWSLCDDLGEPVTIKGLPVEALADVINTLDPLSFTEIKKAIEAHQNAMDEARDVEKKVPGGEPAGAATSPSPFGAGGASTGSVN